MFLVLTLSTHSSEAVNIVYQNLIVALAQIRIKGSIAAAFTFYVCFLRRTMMKSCCASFFSSG